MMTQNSKRKWRYGPRASNIGLVSWCRGGGAAWADAEDQPRERGLAYKTAKFQSLACLWPRQASAAAHLEVAEGADEEAHAEGEDVLAPDLAPPAPLLRAVDLLLQGGVGGDMAVRRGGSPSTRKR